MNPIVRNVLAVVLGWGVGSFVNISLINTGYKVFPIEGVDTNDFEALAEVMSTLGPEHFIFPFLAHALGTLVGAVIAGCIVTTQKMNFSLGIGFIFSLGGLMASFMLSAPMWFVALDLSIAYFPMARVGGIIALKLSKKQ